MIDGKAVANEKKEKLRENVPGLIDELGRMPSLRLVSVGDDEASMSYVRSKMKYGKNIGVEVIHSPLPGDSSGEQVADELKRFSRDEKTDGIVLEAPVPKGLNHAELAANITPEKDVDCITEVNQGRIALNREYLLPATANAIMTLIELQEIPRGSHVTVINRSPVIGRPLSNMLLNRDYTVTVCHSKTPDIKRIARESDLVVVGVGKANFLTRDYVTSESIVIDAGINFIDGKMTGDADFSSLEPYVKAITPVPGGVGPVTTACMFENLLKAAVSR